MKRFPQIILIIIILVLGFLFFRSSSNPSSTNNKPQPTQEITGPKVKLVIPNGKTSQIPVIMALGNGLFKKNGADVEVKQSGKNASSILISGQADAAVGSPLAYINAYVAGTKLSWIGALSNNNRLVFVSHKDAKDIKIVGLQGSIGNRRTATVVLKSLNLDVNKITLQDFGSPEAKLMAFKTKKVDAINMNKVDWLIFVKNNNLNTDEYKILIDSDKDDLIQGQNTLVVSSDFLKNNQVAVENVSKALIEGIIWMQQNRDKAIDILAKNDDLPKDDAAVYIDNYIETSKSFKFTPTLIQAQTFLNYAVLDNPEAKDFKIDGYISTAVADSLRNSGFLKANNSE